MRGLRSDTGSDPCASAVADAAGCGRHERQRASVASRRAEADFIPRSEPSVHAVSMAREVSVTPVTAVTRGCAAAKVAV